MNPLYQECIDGTLASVDLGSSLIISITNNLPVKVNMAWLDSYAQQVPWGTIAPGETYTSEYPAEAGTYFMFTVSATGSFVTVFQIAAGTADYSVEVSMLTGPNDIGIYPIPNSAVVIPPDSPRILVGAGLAPNGSAVIREQFWQRGANSYSLAGNETRVFSTTTTSGTQSTSSTTTDVSASLGLSASAGWGPISAGISSSLSTNTSTFQQVTVSDQFSAYVSDTLTNPSSDAVMYLQWQLTDVVTIFDAGGLAASAVISAENPVLTAGPYDLNTLSSPPLAIAARMAHTPRELARAREGINRRGQKRVLADAVTRG